MQIDSRLKKASQHIDGRKDDMPIDKEDMGLGCLLVGAGVLMFLGSMFFWATVSSSHNRSFEEKFWNEAVERGYAEKVIHSKGEGYVWKESVCPQEK